MPGGQPVVAGPAPPPRPGTAAARGMPGPRARLAELLDAGSLIPLTPGASSGVLAVLGRVSGIPVVAFTIDPRVDGGALGHAGCTVSTTGYAAAGVQAGHGGGPAAGFRCHLLNSERRAATRSG